MTERQGSLLVAGAGVVFSFTAIAYRAVDDATEWQFLFYRGGSTALAMVLLIVLRRGSRPVRLRGVSARTWLAGAVLAAVSMLVPSRSGEDPSAVARSSGGLMSNSRVMPGTSLE